VPDEPRLEQLRRRVRADPASIAFAALAEEYRRSGRYLDAIETCRVGLQRHPAYLSARVTLGRALIGVGDHEAARLELEAVLRAAPENLAAIRAMAEIYSHLQDVEETLPDDAREPEAVDRAPDHFPAEPAPAPAPPVAPISVVQSGPQPPPYQAAVDRLERFLNAISAARAALG
jgi:tetratricopeptide (TPR) repeat protein